MNRISELPSGNDIIASLSSCKTAGIVQKAAPHHAELKSFQLVFDRLRRTPDLLRMMLQNEFQFDGMVNSFSTTNRGDDLLKQEWFNSSFVVPNYTNIQKWVKKSVEEAKKGKTIVTLMPSRTNTKWFTELVLCTATEIRFIEGRITMPGFKSQSPFPDCIAIYGPGSTCRVKPTTTAAVSLLPCKTSLTDDKVEYGGEEEDDDEEELFSGDDDYDEEDDD